MADLRRRMPDIEDGGERIHEDIGYNGTEQPELDKEKIHKKLHLKITDATDHVNMKKKTR